MTAMCNDHICMCVCDSDEVVTQSVSPTVDDEIRRIAVIRLSAKLHSCQFINGADGKAKVCICCYCLLLLLFDAIRHSIPCQLREANFPPVCTKKKKTQTGGKFAFFSLALILHRFPFLSLPLLSFFLLIF